MKKFVVLFAILAIAMVGCKPAPPSTPTTTINAGDFVPSNLLIGAVSTCCTISKFTVSVTNYWVFVKPFLPVNITNVAVPAINGLIMGIKAGNNTVIAWYHNKENPNPEQLQKDLLALKESVVPIIQQIMTYIASLKDKPAETAVTKEMNREISSKAILSCTIDELIIINTQVQALQPIS
jgi:hypothetical protein